MTLETELKRLVTTYAAFDPAKNEYVSQLDQSTLLRLDANFVKLINQQLLADGPEHSDLTKNYRKLTPLFHPDRTHFYSLEVRWLERTLSVGKNDGICFKTIHGCYEKLTEPQKYKESQFADIKSKEDCRQWLEQLKNKATTYSSRSLCDSLLNLLEQSSSYFDEMGKIRPVSLKVLAGFIPILFATYGAIMLAEEIFAVYALYFILLKSGQYLSHKESGELKHLGASLQQVSMITATATTTLLVRLLEMTFWASRQIYATTLELGTALLNPMISTVPPGADEDMQATRAFCTDFILASKTTTEGIAFSNPELKAIAAPLEKYHLLNSQQFFSSMRLGNQKRLMVEAFLFRMRVLDRSPEPINSKLKQAQKELECLKANTAVYSCNTAKAVDQAEQIMELLREPICNQLVVYEDTSPDM